jgi:hypothetical protein
MNLGQVKTRLAKLINEYSVRGDITPDVADNVNDFYLKMHDFIDIAQKNVANIALIRRVYNFTNSGTGAANKYTWINLPNNFLRLESVSMSVNGEYKKFYFYQFRAPNKLGIPRDLKGDFEIVYVAAPETITTETSDSYSLEVSEIAQNAVVYYAAALLLQMENYSAYTQFMSLYEEVMRNINNDNGVRQKQVKKVW